MHTRIASIPISPSPPSPCLTPATPAGICQARLGHHEAAAADLEALLQLPVQADDGEDSYLVRIHGPRGDYVTRHQLSLMAEAAGCFEVWGWSLLKCPPPSASHKVLTRGSCSWVYSCQDHATFVWLSQSRCAQLFKIVSPYPCCQIHRFCCLPYFTLY